MSVYIKARNINNPDVKSLLVCVFACWFHIFILVYCFYANICKLYGESNEQLSRILEPLQTNDALEKIFHDLVGKDGHGYCKTYGTGVTRSAVYPKEVGPSQASSTLTVEEITQQVRNTVTQEIEERLAAEIE
ncbi:hypothetical protein ACSBR1_024575 [Camellia fascicularis]